MASGNKQKNYMGIGKVGTVDIPKWEFINLLTASTLCVGKLSWWKISKPFLHFLIFFLCNHTQRGSKPTYQRAGSSDVESILKSKH